MKYIGRNELNLLLYYRKVDFIISLIRKCNHPVFIEELLDSMVVTLLSRDDVKLYVCEIISNPGAHISATGPNGFVIGYHSIISRLITKYDLVELIPLAYDIGIIKNIFYHSLKYKAYNVVCESLRYLLEIYISQAQESEVPQIINIDENIYNNVKYFCKVAINNRKLSVAEYINNIAIKPTDKRSYLSNKSRIALHRSLERIRGQSSSPARD